MSVDLTDTGCSKQAHGEALPGDGPCPLCGRPRCSARAKTRDGERCRQHPIPGGRTCRFHGSATEAAREKAAENLQQQAAAGLAEKSIWKKKADPVTNPIEALQQLAGQVQAALNQMGSELEFESLESRPVQTRAWLTLVRESRQLLTDMERNGIFSRIVEIEGAKVQRMAVAYDGSFSEAFDQWPELREVLTAEVLVFLSSRFIGLLRAGEANELEAGGAA